MKVLVLAALAAFAVAAPVATADTMKPQLVRTIHDAKLGTVVTTVTRQAIYTWTREPKGAIRCTGACARMWPPVLVARGTVVPMHVAGIMGELGTIRRPDGMRQLTLDRRALYTYAHEKPGQVLCNDVDGWFAVKA
jgi:predicted lipoprotein with Yx(FWY)xxD motif